MRGNKRQIFLSRFNAFFLLVRDLLSGHKIWLTFISLLESR